MTREREKRDISCSLQDDWTRRVRGGRSGAGGSRGSIVWGFIRATLVHTVENTFAGSRFEQTSTHTQNRIIQKKYVCGRIEK
jgi:hypothetical protein